MANPNWVKGVSGNPNGKPAGNQNFVDRARHLLDKHTIESITELSSNDEKFKKLSVYDGMIVRRVVEAIAESGKGSMDSLLDRLLGKPPQYMEQKIDQTITVSLEERRRAAEREADEILRFAGAKRREQSVTVN